jgi:hypothetical protein
MKRSCSAYSLAEAAKERLVKQPGFRDRNFEIAEYELNRDQWTEGFVTVD